MAPKTMSVEPASSQALTQRSEIRSRQEWLVNEARAIQAKVDTGTGRSDEGQTRLQRKQSLEFRNLSSDEVISQAFDATDIAPSPKSSKTSVKVFEMKHGSMTRLNSNGTLNTSSEVEAKSKGTKNQANNSIANGKPLGTAGSIETSQRTSSPMPIPALGSSSQAHSNFEQGVWIRIKNGQRVRIRVKDEQRVRVRVNDEQRVGIRIRVNDGENFVSSSCDPRCVKAV